MQHTKKTMQKSNPAATRTANKNSQPVIIIKYVHESNKDVDGS